MMDDTVLLDELEQLARGLEVEVRYEPAGGRVGYCILRDEQVAVIDERLTIPQRAAALAQILASLDIENVYIPPAVREVLESYRQSCQSS